MSSSYGNNKVPSFVEPVTIMRSQIIRIIACVTVMLICMGTISCSASGNNDQADARLEQSVCGLKEPFVFWLWSRAAGVADSSRVLGQPGIEEVSLRTKDDRLIRGYQLKSSAGTAATSKAKGYLLVAQGNAMLADQIISSFRNFSSLGYDVYVFDYRGYGRSGGKRRLQAILSDYREIIVYLNSLSYPQQLYYGISFGGIVLLNALRSGEPAQSVVIDSTPSRLSGYGCPPIYDPVNNLPKDSSHMLFIAGGRDPVVTPEASRELLEVAATRGASVLRDPHFSHPFMDRNIKDSNRRRRAVESFLVGDQH